MTDLWKEEFLNYYQAGTRTEMLALFVLIYEIDGDVQH